MEKKYQKKNLIPITVQIVNHNMKLNDTDLVNKENFTNIFNNIKKIIRENNFIFGNEVKILENKLANYTKCKNCITVGSGTDALIISLLSINIKKNDEILIPSFSWLSVLEAVKILGAKPIFIDTNINTFNLDETEIIKKISSKTKAIISTSLFGRTANLNKIKKISRKYKIFFIEDAAQNFGSKVNKKDSCSIADITCTSFFPSKNLGCFGDGGAIFTSQKKNAKKIFLLRNHGQ